MIGRVIGNYRITSTLGSGGMGTVYRGIDQMVERDVAIKMLRREISGQPEILQRFRAEAITLAKLNHQNIATLYSFFNEGDEYFMVMEFIPGRTLDKYIEGADRLPIENAVGIFAQAADGIECAHQLGILHRDIKPTNIMVTEAGVVKVMDFGIARALRTSRMTREGRIVGTIEYMAPERIEGNEDDSRSDIYSLGVVLFELLTGRLPFDANSEFHLMQAHLTAPPPQVREFSAAVPEAISAAVNRALAKRPEDRFATAQEFRDALVAGLPSGARLASATQLAAVFRSPGSESPTVVDMAKPTRLAETVEAAAAGIEPAPAKRLRPAGPAGLGALLQPGWRLYAAASAAVVVLALLVWALVSMGGAGDQELANEPEGALTEPAAAFADAPGAEITGGGAADPAAEAGGEAPTPLDELLKNTRPVEGEIPGITAGPARPRSAPAKTAGRASPDEERRRRALEALNAAEEKAAKLKEAEERRRRALEALDQ